MCATTAVVVADQSETVGVVCECGQGGVRM
jgi:hypothetical protein